MARFRRTSYFEQSVSDRRELFEETRNPYARKTFSETLTVKEAAELADAVGDMDEDDHQ